MTKEFLFSLFMIIGLTFSVLVVPGQVDTSLLPTGNYVVYHSYYTLSYSEVHEQAEWVMYELTPAEASGNVKRTNNFRMDTSVITNSASLEDYFGSNYDRGHLAPAGDMAFSETAMSESFYLSNISPQDPGFNRGKWKSLESLCRSWGQETSIFIVTGPVFIGGFETIGVNQVTVPTYFFKIVFDLSPNSERSIAFLMPNEPCNEPLPYYTIPVDSIELLTGIDFFSGLNDKLEDSLEVQNRGSWLYIPTQEMKVPKSCDGITQSGKRCRRHVTGPSKYCWQHRE